MNLPAEPIDTLDPGSLLARQREAFRREAHPSLAARKRRLASLRRAVLAHRAELEAAVSADFGHRSRHETALMEIMGVVHAIDYLSRKLRRFMRPEKRRVGMLFQPGRAWVAYQPKGVIGVMSPWNYPVSLALVPVATAIAAGNRAMLKPSELTPRTSALLQRLLADAFAEDEVAVVLGGPETGAAFSSLPFDHLFFTGSTAVGRQVMKAASDNLVPVTLELGGKSPAVIAPGQVDGAAIDSLVYGKLSNAGQTCVAPDYVMVHRSDLDGFLAAYQAAVSAFYPAGPVHEDYASIVNDRHYARLAGLLADARAKGARVIEAGVAPETARERVRTLAPTLVVGAGAGMAILEEEIFGPILLVHAYDSLDEVIRHINAGPRPLALYYFGKRDAHCERLLRETTSGNVGINNTLVHVAIDDLPFGGVGASGMGAYHGIEGLRSMSHAKGVYVQARWNMARLVHAPYGRLANWLLALTLRS